MTCSSVAVKCPWPQLTLLMHMMGDHMNLSCSMWSSQKQRENYPDFTCSLASSTVRDAKAVPSSVPAPVTWAGTQVWAALCPGCECSVLHAMGTHPGTREFRRALWHHFCATKQGMGFQTNALCFSCPLPCWKRSFSMAWLNLCSRADLTTEEDKINTLSLAC